MIGTYERAYLKSVEIKGKVGIQAIQAPGAERPRGGTKFIDGITRMWHP